ncbi:ATP-dependent RNA helicase DHX8-like isoform X3 [Mya arenaria]|uniref:ATP-dependent RNA helicase DHX8-like isoform X1 n=1 Tax=Mya arenaria TaxID=6604 RepID=UPI0022E01983|nr:ATP-dependent RNA helicase DHX8-like isoform X1 [Mya arenaria]XP_052803139.1 ATP-dependent RNA helicase DHX8-like isoform X2 [Mya arenaria]XP_052803147.1 ATP-dependent RNA helicase DHX8-like isoform X3 [Mya arenaria]
MDELQKLEHLSLVSKVCTELDNHLGMNDKDLAEFIIDLAEKNNTFEAFKKALLENGAEFGESLIANLLRLIQKMKPKPQKKVTAEVKSAQQLSELEMKKKLFPGLALPNEVREKSPELPEDKEKDKNIADSMMGELEALMSTAKSIGSEKEKTSRDNRSRSRSPRKKKKRRSRSRSRSRSRDRRRSRSRDRKKKKRRDRSYSRSRSRSRSRDRDRNREEKYRDRDGKRDRRGGDRGHDRGHEMPVEVEVGKIYAGRVMTIMQFGCFVAVEGVRKKSEGLVHVSQLRSEGRVSNVSDVVQKGQKVKVKVLSYTGNKMSLSIKDVDQNTGRDLNPKQTAAITGGEKDIVNEARNPDRPSAVPLVTVPEQNEGTERKRVQRMSSPEKWEWQQMAAANVIDITELPDFDEETGVLPRDDDSDEDIEIEIVEEQAPFLAGHGKESLDLSPIKIVKNPDGSLSQAAMMQSALSKERREIKQQQREAEMNSVPNTSNNEWQDPMADGDKRYGSRGVGSQPADLPEWKKSIMGGQKASYGKKEKKSILEQRQSLPIFKLKDELTKAVHDNQVLVVIGETGSGKTTQITQYLAEAGYTTRGKIGCTQPRRVAAMSVAKRVSEEYGCRLGQEVGYTMRFEDCTSPETKIKYMTEGMLLRECLVDRDMMQYSIIMLDEAHERTVHTDVLFGLLKDAVKKRKDLKLIVTSATLDAVKFSQYFFESPIFTIPGRTYPVEILYTKEAETDYLDASLITVMQIHLMEPPGDILLFLTGQEEIDTACEILYERMKALGPEVPELIILPVYSALPSEMQTRIFDPAPPGSRKVVIATNIAETSLTIDGIYYVVDPGFVKQKVYNSKTGMDQLIVTPISQAQAKQRAGRAGRTGPGKCYRLYTERAYRDEMLPTAVPEIQRTNLASTVLSLKAMGINDLLTFDFMDAPPMQTLVSAMEQLHALSALDDEGLLTRLGRRMAEFPLEPMLSKMLIMSVHVGCSDDILTIVSMLSVQNVFYRPKDKQDLADQRKAKFHQIEGDHVTLLAVYNAWKNNKFSSPWCFENFVQVRTLKRAQDVRKQMLGIMDRHKLDVVSAGKATSKVQKAICSGFFRNAAKKDPQEGYRTLVDGQVVYIHPSSALFNRQPEWVIYHELVLTTKEYMREVTAMDPKWLVEFAPKFFRFSDPTRLSKQKKQQKIEPLYNKYDDPNSWRISRAFRKFHTKVTF